MTTVINTPGNNVGSEDGGSGWAVAVIILLVVIGVGAYFLINYRSSITEPAANGQTNINVTLPDPNAKPTTNTP